LINAPSPQTVIEGKRLNQLPAGTSGLVSSQAAKDLIGIRADVPIPHTQEQMFKEERRNVFALYPRHYAL